MAGTKLGGRKAAATNRMRYGLDFYRQVGAKGGRASRGGGFAMNRELAVEAGRKGGHLSKRHKTRNFPCPYCPTRLGTRHSRHTHVSKFHYDKIN